MRAWHWRPRRWLSGPISRAASFIIQGRLLPLHGWYRLFEAAGMTPPQRSAHTLPSHRLAKWILIAWSAGVPLLAAGLAAAMPALIRAGSICLLAGVVFNAIQAYLIASAVVDI